MSLPPYPEYRKSGVRWLGPIPSHWEVRKLKHACSVFPSNVDKHSREGEKPVLLCNYTDVYYNERITSELTLMEATATDDQVAKFALMAGDTIVTKDSESADDIGVSAYVPEDLPGVICGYHLSMVRPREGVVGGFVKRLFDSAYTKAKLAISSNGLTRVGLGQFALDNIELPFPPVAEQLIIAAFLDRETAKIDALIAEQERLLALLTEKRQAVISNAITKGLNPDVPVRESGVEWLGSVPSLWRIGKAKFYVSVLPGFAFPSHGFSSLLEDVRLLRGVNVGVGRLRWDDVVYWKREEGDGLDRYELAVGDVVIGMDRPLIGEGMRVATVQKDDVPCLLLQRVAKIIPGREILGSFIERLLASGYFEAHFSPETTGVSVPHISGDQISNFVIPVPPVKEQREICDFIDLEIGKIEKLIEQALRMVDLLQERRAALISSVVTGQVDVREVA